MSYCVTLDVTVIVLTSPDIAAFPLHCRGHHVINQTVLIGETSFDELIFEFRFKNFLKQILELAVLGLEDGVLGAHIDRIIT